MKRLLLVLAAAAVLLPGAAGAAACSPLECGASQFSLAHGTLLAYHTSTGAPVSVADLRTGESLFSLPPGLVYGDVLVHLQGRRIEWYDATTGRKTGQRALPWKVRLAGASQDGSRAVAFRSKTSLVVATPRASQLVELPAGNWDFDALRGNRLVLIRFLRVGGYQVRLLDLAHPARGTRLLKDPHESGTIWGQAWSRFSSPDGRYVFTLYISSNGAAMVHELDLAVATARCIDLPGTGDYGAATSWALALSPDGRTLWAAGPGYGRVVAIDVRTRRVSAAFRISLAYWNLGNGTRAAVSPDGARLALADGETVALVDLQAHRILQRAPSHAVAVAFAPTGELRSLPYP
jgi:hypothetical protein